MTAARGSLQRLRFRMPSVAVVWADGGYAGRLVGYARLVLKLSIPCKRVDGSVMLRRVDRQR